MTVSQPEHFHLLWDHELDTLRPILENLRKHLDQVIAGWHSLYLLHLGNRRSLTESEFTTIFGQELRATVEDLLQKDMESFTSHVRETGEALAEHKVPFSEVIVSLHLYEESASDYFPSFPPVLPKTYHSFDKLSHCRMIVLADAYFRSHTALTGTRILELEREAAKLGPEKRSRFHGIVGASAPMRELYRRIEAAGRTRGTVLIVGESGTGKELIARAIHECGPDPGAPLVELNCAAIPKDLIESELFGYKRGAFSGANTEYLGLFRAAHGGALFLDEITEMSAETQSKLLRALQEHRVRPVGSTREIDVDVRLLASTNRDPEQAVRDGQLREDLYYRLQANVLRVPPLRARAEDIPLLLCHFIDLFNERRVRPSPVTAIDDAALEAMSRYPWPGNVRELSNAIEGAFTFGRSPIIALEDLPGSVTNRQPPQRASTGLSPATAPGTFADVERDLIRRALETTAGNKVRAAKLLRISRKKLYNKIIKYGLEF
jgi:transcriptional regulator with PAS, ATPase and Fis domain